jgi:lysophospholipase L1-like esterase
MKRKSKLIVWLAIIILLTMLEIWSVRYGNNNPQTGIEHLAGIFNFKKIKNISEKKILFLGDSITARQDWNGLFGINDILNAGVSGNTTDDVLARLNEVFLFQPKPEKVFLMIGINDLIMGKDINHVMTNYQKIIDQIKAASPESKIYIESILPINNEVSPLGRVESQEIIDLNKKLSLMAVKNNATFINLYPLFCGPDNQMRLDLAADGVHPNAKGYAIWKYLVGPYIK